MFIESKNTSEMDKLCEKLRRAYMRRDHYAQLYYKAMAQLEHTKWELAVAKKKIQELQSLSKLYRTCMYVVRHCIRILE